MTNPDTRGDSLKALAQALRPSQWTKNAVVLAAFFFALGDPEQHIELADAVIAVPAALLFCLISSGIYLLNDLLDVESDRKHPLKMHRPIAAGRVALPVAGAAAIALIAAGLLGARALSPGFAAVAGGYVAIQVVYSVGLKRIALVDILVIATGFVLRAMAGAVVLGAEISAWLLLCAFLLALFLALCKRRHEKMLLNDDGAEHRASLEKYDQRLLDQLIAIVSAATIVSYAIYTLAPDTVTKFQTRKLGFTIPFVIFGIFRYLDLVYRHKKGGRPETILLRDIPTLINLVLYGACVVTLFLCHR